MQQPLPHTDPLLLKQISEGDESAFGRLFHSWQPLLAGYIYKVTESRPLTEEIVQDVFLKIWQTRETLANITHFKSYLFVISRNHALNVVQKNMRQLLQQKAYEQSGQAIGNTGPSSEELAGLTLIDVAVDQLPARRKEVYLLHRHEKLTYQQIADKLGIGRESVKTHLELAMKDISRYVLKHLPAALAFLFLSR